MFSISRILIQKEDNGFMEQKLKNLKVRGKLKAAFSSVLKPFLVVILVAIIAISYLDLEFSNFYKTAYQSSVRQMEIQRDVQMIGKLVLLAVTTDNPEEANKYMNVSNGKMSGIIANEEFLKDALNSPELIEKLDVSVDELQAVIKEMAASISANDKATAMVVFDETFYGKTTELQNILTEINEYVSSEAINEYNVAKYLGIAGIIAMIVLGTASVLNTAKIVRKLAEIITAPVNRLKEAADSMRKGVFDIEVDYEAEDEFGELAEDFRNMNETLTEIIQDAGYLMSEMGEGNFNVNTSSEDSYVGEFKNLIVSMRKMNRQMDMTLRNIDSAAEQVSAGADQLARGAQALAEGATEQAGAVEELTATIENVNMISEQNAKGSEAAAAMISEAAAGAQRSQEELKELTEAMTRISDTSKEIQNIIAAIEDIASQTNLLSLNASIEAARAGEAGRGFAVVADQIGKLASDSAQSAVSTKELIEKSLYEIENGNAITEKTVAAFNNILKKMYEFAEVAKQSSEESRNQSEMLDQIEKGIAQIAQVVQSNSASAQETSATSEELSAQSENLKTLVGKFTLRA